MSYNSLYGSKQLKLVAYGGSQMTHSAKEAALQPYLTSTSTVARQSKNTSSGLLLNYLHAEGLNLTKACHVFLLEPAWMC